MPGRRLGAGGWGAMLVALAVLAGCAADKPKPKPLEPVTPTSGSLNWRRQWAA